MDWAPIYLSLKLSLVTTLLLLLVGLPLAYWLSRRRVSMLKVICEALVAMPLVLPPSVLGFYLLLAFSPQRGLGAWLQHTFHIQLVFSFPGLVVASLIYSLPFMVGPIRSALQQLPVAMAQASYTLGKTEWQTFVHVLLPNVRASVITAMVMTFAHTLGEFGVVLMIGGNIPGVTRVASIAVYDAVEGMDYHAANQYALLLFAISFALITTTFIINRRSVKNLLE